MSHAHQSGVRNWRLTLCVLGLALANEPAWADRAAYSGVVELQAQVDSLIVRHHHDWSAVREGDHLRLTLTAETPYGVAPEHAWIEFELADQQPKRMPSPPLTHLSISANGHVIGLSNIKLMNAIQLVVWDRDGELLAQRAISARVVCLSDGEWQQLQRSEPELLAGLTRSKQIAGLAPGWREGERIFLHYNPAGPPALRAAQRQRLSPSLCDNPLDASIGESVSNFVRWFDEQDPQPQLVEREGRIDALQVRGRSGQWISIPLFPEWLEADGR